MNLPTTHAEAEFWLLEANFVTEMHEHEGGSPAKMARPRKVYFSSDARLTKPSQKLGLMKC